MTTDFNILCIVKHEHNEAWQTAHSIKEWFEARNVHSFLLSSHEEKESIVKHANKSHLALVIGGDGTMLATARALHNHTLPIFGINYGKVGFLTEAEPIDWEYWAVKLYITLHSLNSLEIKEDFSSILKKYSEKFPQEINPLFIEEHMLFHCTVRRENAIIYEGYALNDAVIARSEVVRAVALSLFVNDNHMSSLRCDGLIISTPLGATAYAISAHGPLALPGLDAQIITPICPFAGAFPPCVVSGTSKVSINVDDMATPVVLTLDGQESFSLKPQDKVEISAHNNKMHLLISDEAWYIKRLAKRGYIQPGPGSNTPKTII